MPRQKKRGKKRKTKNATTIAKKKERLIPGYAILVGLEVLRDLPSHIFNLSAGEKFAMLRNISMLITLVLRIFLFTENAFYTHV